MRFTCPSCGASHDRGPVNGLDAYRCLGCGWSGRLTVDSWARAFRNPSRGSLTQAQEWVVRYCLEHGIDWENVSVGERTRVHMLVPCTIRCWRVGQAVDVPLGEPCPECGRKNEYQRMTRYAAILGD